MRCCILFFLSRRTPSTPPSWHKRLISTITSSSSDLISLLIKCSTLRHIKQAHGVMVLTCLDQDNIFLSRFIETCSSLGFSNYAYSVFTNKTQPSIYLYNTMIKSLSLSQAQPQAAVFLYNSIQAVGLRPDTYSFPFVLKAVVRLSALSAGRQIHCQAVGIGLDCDLHVATGLIQMYSSCGWVSDARKVFDGVRLRGDVALWNAMVAGYAKVGDLENGRELFECMTERNVISWTTVVAGYAQMNKPDEAIAVFRRMQIEKVKPDEIAMLAALSACAQLGALDLGQWIHNYINNHGLHRMVSLSNALIDMYAKSGNIEKAIEVFENMGHRSVVTWTTMIAGLALHGLGTEALEMFSRMEMAGVKPNDITFIAVLSACSHVGLVQVGRSIFSSMRLSYGIEPKIEHYGCMIDLLGRAGYLQEAEDLVRGMPFEANAAIWGSLLAASNTHADPKLGELALRHLIKLEPNNSGNYSLLSNIYASLGRWNESRTVRKMMRDTGVKKMAGGSFIELNNRVHEFIAGVILHPQFDTMYDVLSEINEHLQSDELWPEASHELLEFGGMWQLGCKCGRLQVL